MKFLGLLSTSRVALALSVLHANLVLAANSFAGSNLYYAAGLSGSERATLLSGMQSAGMKVLRVWLDGESTATTKATTITTYPDLEPVTVGTYNDTVLDLLDDFMLDSYNYGIKLLISMHSWNALSRPGIYGQWYGTDDFYEQAQPQEEFDNRLVHVLNHVHSTLGTPWKTMGQYIFGFEAENEAMIGNGQQYIVDHQSWQCDRAATIKGQLGDNSGILVLTGGEWLAQLAQAADKMLLFEEWGSCYFNTSNNDCPTGTPLDASTRNTNIETWASQITAAGMPWLYWEILPNADPHYSYDYEIGIGDPAWSTLEAAAQAALQAPAAFDYSQYLL
ncbi:glycoside hydrolase family 5 protein [Jaapia argillacea MUCL 33604]|uniref:Glycoside hydrolase family 5 protein n=1 Tax=Jaapia argillacea MUCL 33604 TaxID=933084 RepID=A0A067Q5C7_9AGAM|nr:glycoside hydrolase family 5 protein [Jaapia argillacea MUCL 33604]